MNKLLLKKVFAENQLAGAYKILEDTKQLYINASANLESLLINYNNIIDELHRVAQWN